MTRSKWRSAGSKILEAQAGGVIVMILLSVIVFSLINPAYLRPASLITILQTIAITGMIACGSTFVVVAGTFDLTVGGIVALSGLAAVEVIQALGDASWPVAVVVGIGVGAVAGAVGGLLVVQLRIPPFIATLGMMFIVRAVAMYFGSSTVHGISGPDAFVSLGRGRVLGVPVPVIIFIVIAVVLLVVERRTTYGRRVYAVGANADSAEIAGVSAYRVRMVAFLISGGVAGLAGVISTAQIKAAAGFYAQGLELSVLTAILIGGVSMYGGKGSVLQAALGAVFVGTVSGGLSLLGVPSDFQVIVTGCMLAAAIVVYKGLDSVKLAMARSKLAASAETSATQSP